MSAEKIEKALNFGKQEENSADDDDSIKDLFVKYGVENKSELIALIEKRLSSGLKKQKDSGIEL